MINLKYFYKQKYRFKKATILFLFISSVNMSPSLFAFTLTGELGAYLPSDQLIRQLYGSSAVTSVRLGVPYDVGFDWTLSASIQKFQSENAGIKSEVTMTSLLTGFEKRLPGPNLDKKYIEPFIGAGISLIHLSDSLNSNTQESDQKESYIYGFYWEIGLLFPAFSSPDAWFVMDLKQSNLARFVYGDINLGGTVYSIGYRVQF